ncbi:MAG: sulfurtransferase [Corynebacterium sp.]|nr:sulfurtransferase [Corynebacterium sp.]
MEFDPHPPFQEYAHPEHLVSAPWLSARLGVKGLRLVEVNEDALLYDIGHIPTASRINFHTELMDPTTRDVVNPEQFAELMRDKGISRDDTVIIYGDKSNWWAAYALWIFKLYGHPDVRLLDGGRDSWMTEERDTSYAVPTYDRSDYPVVERNDSDHRVFVGELRENMDEFTVIDTRSAAEYAGEPTQNSSLGDSVYGTTIRHGHIPGAHHVQWNKATYPNATFRNREHLESIYGPLNDDNSTTWALYSHLGAQSAHTWFVLRYLLGYDNVRNYDGSWAEWGNMIGMDIVSGTAGVNKPAL